ncbi:MAG: hypothetical protein HFI34_07480 [Lachnospiraceae bacterium]|nr:hypothetical protein [Lachnospiraceae bacterium]
MRNSRKIVRAVALASSVVIAGGSLTGCKESKKVQGNTYTYKYNDSDNKYVLGTTGGSTSVKGKTGKIFISSDNAAKLTDVCIQGFLYKNNSGTAKVQNDSIEIRLCKNFKTASYATIIGPLPKTDKEIYVPIDIGMDVNVKYTKTK